MPTTRATILREGLMAGLLGYLAVAGFFALLNVSQGLGPLSTPDAIGRALLGDTIDPLGRWAPALAYNGLHLVASLVLGMIGAGLAYRAELDHDLAMGLVFFTLAVGGFLPLMSGAVMVEVLHALRWTEVLAGSLAGAVGTLGYLSWTHRKLVATLLEKGEAHG